jgi:AcrR family transcriptional regulator
MPRVSEAHLAARRQQILDAARTCFLRNGFHTTSMQDVISEAGLSVGAVYRYFRSKNEIIAAIAEQYAGQVGGTLVDLADDPGRSLLDAMQAAVEVIEANTGEAGPMRLAVQVWAEGLRDPAVATIVEHVYGSLRENFVRLAERAVRVGELPPDTDPEAAGAALFALVLGYGLQRILTGRPDPDSYRGALRSLLGSAPVPTSGTPAGDDLRERVTTSRPE